MEKQDQRESCSTCVGSDQTSRADQHCPLPQSDRNHELTPVGFSPCLSSVSQTALERALRGHKSQQQRHL